MCFFFSPRHSVSRQSADIPPQTAPRNQVISPQTSTGNPSPGPNSPTFSQISPTDLNLPKNPLSSPGLSQTAVTMGGLITSVVGVTAHHGVTEPASPKYGNFGSNSVPGTPPPLPPRNRRRESSVSDVSSPQQVSLFIYLFSNVLKTMLLITNLSSTDCK